jgi:hypothetical protein
MEELMSPDNLGDLDIRSRVFGWNPRERYDFISSVKIDPAVPEEVQRLLMTAKNLIIYSCFHYPFNVIAAQTAFSALELAIRLRSDADGFTEKLTGLHAAMQRALEEKWISDDEILCCSRRQQNIFGPQEAISYTELSSEQQFVEVLAKIFPKYRNVLAHGSSSMDNLGASMALDVNRMINQIFRNRPFSDANE